MYNIIINDSIETLGLITFRISKDANDNLIREGYLKTHLYIEEITSLECNLYQFTFELYDIKEVAELSEDELIKLYDNELK